MFLFSLFLFKQIHFTTGNLFSLGGFKGNLSLLEIAVFFPGGLKKKDRNYAES